MKRASFLILVVMVFVSGCANFGAAKTDEEIVRERAQQWLNALLAGDIDKAWSYTSPGYRSTNKAKAYYRHVGGSGNWTAGEVDSVSCDDERCNVRTMISYKLQQIKLENTRPLDNVWIKVDGKWWIYQM